MSLYFKLRNDLIYYINFDDDRKRLYIFNIFKKEIFELTHDRQNYKEFHKIYNRIVDFIYLKYFFKNLRAYIKHCSKYKFN